MVTDPGISTEIDWSALRTSDDLDWDAIFADAFVGVNKKFLKGVKHL